MPEGKREGRIILKKTEKKRGEGKSEGGKERQRRIEERESAREGRKEKLRRRWERERAREE